MKLCVFEVIRLPSDLSDLSKWPQVIRGLSTKTLNQNPFIQISLTFSTNLALRHALRLFIDFYGNWVDSRHPFWGWRIESYSWLLTVAISQSRLGGKLCLRSLDVISRSDEGIWWPGYLKYVQEAFISNTSFVCFTQARKFLYSLVFESHDFENIIISRDDLT